MQQELKEKSRWFMPSGLLSGVLLFGVLASTTLAVTNDRFYKLGDENGEGAALNITVGSGNDFDLSFDTVGESGNNTFSDLTVGGDPKYVSVNARPGDKAGQYGVEFNGDDYLWSWKLNAPNSSVSSTGSNEDVVGPLNYDGISNRGFKLWVNPNSTGQGSEQIIVTDADQHGVVITAANTWGMLYAGTITDTSVAVDFDQWHEVVVVRPVGPSGPNSGSRLYVDGIAVASTTGGYNGGNPSPLVLGANTDGTYTDFQGGQSGFFKGVMDDMEMFVIGDNTSQGGQDYGTFDYLTDVGAVDAFNLYNGIAGDLDQNGVIDQADVDDFVAGYGLRNAVTGGSVVGDMSTYASGDMNFDGRVDLHDLGLMHDVLDSTSAALLLSAMGVDVPEPATLSLLGLGVFGLLRRKRATV